MPPVVSLTAQGEPDGSTGWSELPSNSEGTLIQTSEASLQTPVAPGINPWASPSASVFQVPDPGQVDRAKGPTGPSEERQSTHTSGYTRQLRGKV